MARLWSPDPAPSIRQGECYTHVAIQASLLTSPRRSRPISDDVTTSSLSNKAFNSASPARSSSRRYSAGAEYDIRSSDTLSINDCPAPKGPHTNHAAAAHSPRAHRRALRDRRKLSGKGSPRLAARPSHGAGSKAMPTRQPRWSNPDPADQRATSPDPMEIFPSPGSHRVVDSSENSASHAQPQQVTADRSRSSLEGVSVVPGGTQYPGLIRSPETYPITEEQLDGQVSKIYSGLAMVEKKAIEIYRDYSDPKVQLSCPQWQHLIALHRTLLQEHHDFYLASLHPSASASTKQLAEKYSMPARMWRYGIHSFLEMLRGRLPDTLEYMTTFIYICYSMLTLLLETVTKFEKTWIECLGDLARYRMALEEVDMRERELWAGIARYWYNKAADKSPDLGRIQHHLAVLARPDVVQQLFHYTKSMTCAQAFPSARDSIPLLFNSLLSNAKSHDPTVTAFVCTHGHLFTRHVTNQLGMLAEFYMSNLKGYIARMGAAFRLHGVYAMSCNFAALFEYGNADAVLPAEFDQSTEPPNLRVYKSAPERWTSRSRLDEIESDLLTLKDSPRSLLTYTSYFAFQAFAVILDQVGDRNVFPTVHVTLAFIQCLALSDAIKHIEAVVPWTGVACFLNTLVRDDVEASVIESDNFTASDEWKQLPEDFCLRGQAWARKYYPVDFFDGCPAEEDGRWIETPSLDVARAYRCLGLGRRIASVRPEKKGRSSTYTDEYPFNHQFNRWLVYDSGSRQFSTTPFAMELQKLAHGFYPFNSATMSTLAEYHA